MVRKFVQWRLPDLNGSPVELDTGSLPFGFETTDFFSGEELLSRVDENPDLIFLSRDLPGMTAVDLCGRIRKKTGFHERPVIVVSPHASSCRLREKCSRKKFFACFPEIPSHDHLATLMRLFFNVRTSGREKAEEPSRVRLESRLLKTIGFAIAGAPNLSSAYEITLRKICEISGWQYGEMWELNQAEDRLVCGSAVYAPDPRFAEFRRISFDRDFGPGEGFPGRVWLKRHPFWLSDLAGDPNFPRGPYAKKAGINVGYGFPVFAEKDRVSVILCFYSSRFREIDRETIGMVSAVASQLGDLIHRKQTDETIRQMNEALELKVKHRTRELELANKAKSLFLANVNHELRTPLTSVIGYTDLLRFQASNTLKPEHLSYLDQITRSAQHLLVLINDTIEIAKIDAGGASLNRELFAAREFCEEALGMVKGQGEAKKVRFALELPDGLSQISADRRKLTQILLNLLTNAIKFSPIEGTIWVRVEQTEVGLQFSVEDGGIGIPKSEQARLFQEFQQVDSRRDEALGGFGIGLALVKRLVDLHGGSVDLESDCQRGAKFVVRIPQPELNSPVTPTPAPKTIGGTFLERKRIMVVDDNQINLKLVLKALQNHNHEVIFAGNGRECLDVVKSWGPELILMDLRMPEMDGFEATRRLKEDPETAHVPIIAFTASIGTEDSELCSEHGFQGVLHKPVRLNDLYGLISAVLKKVA